MEFDELRKHNKEKVKIADQEFDFRIEGDMGGDWATFTNEKYYIYATLNYEVRGVPVQIHKNDDDMETIDTSSFEGEVKDWRDYIYIVDTQVKSILSKKGLI